MTRKRATSVFVDISIAKCSKELKLDVVMTEALKLFRKRKPTPPPLPVLRSHLKN